MKSGPEANMLVFRESTMPNSADMSAIVTPDMRPNNLTKTRPKPDPIDAQPATCTSA